MGSYESPKIVSRSSNSVITIECFNRNRLSAFIALNATTNELIISAKEGNRLIAVYKMKI